MSGNERESEPHVMDPELADYLSQILDSTFVLNDGTRLKSVFIEWKSLNEIQRRQCIHAIRRTAVGELKQYGGRVPLLFEFNEVPDELAEMLESLAENDPEGLQWTVVDTPE